MADAAATDDAPRLAANTAPAYIASHFSLPMPFLGREDDIARVLDLLDEPSVRLLTLTGVGGVGKTRLAQEIARRAAPEFADGVLYVPLVTVSDPALVLPELYRALGGRPRHESDTLADLIGMVRARHLLLVLDNVEHLLGETPLWLPVLLEAAPRIKVLATSRMPLNLALEQRYTVQPFPIPDAGAPNQLSASAAVRLFAQRARAVNPGFELDQHNVGSVGEVCRRLDGLALAIELAAARSNMLLPAQMLELLSNRMALLTGGKHDAPVRHRSIRDAIGWSYDLLSEEARFTLGRLSVFTGGASLEAIASVTMSDGGENLGRAMTIVAELTDHSLIGMMPGAASEPRYTMLETIREFGLERLRALGGERAARGAHAAWCVALARTSWTRRSGPEQVTWLERLDRERANLRAAVDWLIDEGYAERAIDLINDLRWFWGIRGYESDKIETLSRLEDHPDLQSSSLHRGRMLVLLGGIAYMRGQQDRAERLLLEAVELAEVFEDAMVAVGALCQLGLVLRSAGALDRSTEALERGLTIAREHDDHAGIATAHGNLGLNALLAGDTTAGKALLEESYRVSEARGDTWIHSLISLYLGHLAAEAGDDVTAERLLTTSQERLRAMGNTLDQPKVSLYLAQMASKRGDWQSARQHLEEGLEAARLIQESDFIARTHLELGAVSLQDGNRAEAANHLIAALRHYQDLGSGFGIAASLELLGAIAADSGDARQGAHLLAVASGMERAGTMTWLIGPPVLAGIDTRDRLARTLGERAFAQAWEAGLAMEPNAAIAEAEALCRSVLDEHERAQSRAAGELSGLTSRELEVLRHLADGLGNKEIADIMFVSRRTVASHVEHILTKLDLSSRTAAVAWAIRNGLA